MTLWTQGTTVEWNGSAWQVDLHSARSPAVVGEPVFVTTGRSGVHQQWVADPLAHPATHRATIPESCEHWKRYIVIQLISPGFL